MRIDSSVIGMESARSYTSSTTTARRFTIMDYQGGLAQGNKGLNSHVSSEQEEVEDSSVKSRESDNANSVSEWQDRFQVSTGRITLRRGSTETLNQIRQQCMRYIFQLLFGGRKGIQDNWSKQAEGNNSQNTGNQQNIGQNLSGMNVYATNFKVLNYQQQSWFMETESTSFSTTGTVRTADGREIRFNVDIGMSREFQEYYEVNLEAGQFNMCDPLVINLDTDIASLSDQKFYFDIDADGEMDEVSRLGRGSGYLALDKNGDGIINDGSELFGTSSGNGFADLAAYDEDGNGWIDENDAVWDKLQIWCQDENGQDVLYRLADKGVGAICLQNVSTDFTLRGSTEAQGAIRNTGVFLYENGNVGTVQHVDLVKYSQEA